MHAKIIQRNRSTISILSCLFSNFPQSPFNLIHIHRVYIGLVLNLVYAHTNSVFEGSTERQRMREQKDKE